MEDDLLTGFRKGESGAFKNLYALVFPKVKRWILQNSGSLDDASDVFQEILESLLVKLNMGKLDIESSFEAYIIQACKYKWYNRLRKIKRSEEVTFELKHIHKGEQDFVEEMISLEEEKKKYIRLDNAFKKLSSLCQKILVLIKEGKKPIEIAEIIGAAGATTVNRRKHACLESWRKHLSNSN